MNDREILARLRWMVDTNWYGEVGTYFGQHPIDRLLRFLRRQPSVTATREEVCHALDRAIQRLQTQGPPP